MSFSFKVISTAATGRTSYFVSPFPPFFSLPVASSSSVCPSVLRVSSFSLPRARWLIYRGERSVIVPPSAGRFFPPTVLSVFVTSRAAFATARTVGRAELRGTVAAAALCRADKLFTEGITRRTMMFAVNDSGPDDNELCEIFIFPYRAWLNIAGVYRTVYTER